MTNITIAVGRNIDGEPMADSRWASLRASVRATVEQWGEVHATVSGASASDEWGREDAYWLAASIDGERLDDLRDALALMARVWEQDAIALTVGETFMVGPETEPART